MSGFNDFAPYKKDCTQFIVRNVSPQNKTISIFTYPINMKHQRDLLLIPGVSESDIRASLLKGELRHKFLAKDIELVYSDVDLLQFSDCEKDWLKSLGFTTGIEINMPQLGEDVVNFIIASGTGAVYQWREKIPLIGLKNGTNRMFFTPEKFINGSYFGNTFHITIEHNGRDLYENIDFTIGESSGPGTGYDTINFIAFTPVPHSLLYATYAVKI